MLLLLFVALVLFIRSPWGQDVIVTQATEYVSDKTGTKVEIERLFLTFSGDLSLEGLYLEDKKGDTLVYSKSHQPFRNVARYCNDKTRQCSRLRQVGL